MDHHFNKLTQGAIGHIMKGTKIEEPVFQMLAYKNMPTENTKRFRLVLSDGAYTYQCCILMGDLALKVEKGEFDRYCLLKVHRYMLNEIQGRQVIVLADPRLLVKGSEIGEKLGEPVAWDQPGAPPLSNFPANYHLKANTSMDVEFDNDPFDDFDTAPADKFGAANSSIQNSAKKHKNNRGQASSRSNNYDSPSQNTLNPQLACPISSITPYSNKWLIKGRVTTKTNKRNWANAKGEGTLFAFDLKDESGDIRITAFKAECEKFFDMIKFDQILLVSRGQIRTANRQYNKTSSEYEITLSSDSIVEICEDETGCPTVTYDFKELKSLQDSFGGFVDIIAIIKEVHDVETLIQKKTNKELIKRSMIIVDQEAEVELAIWGDDATNFKGEVDDVLVVRGVKVSDFNNVSLSTTSNSTIEINPSLNAAHELRGWYSRCKDNLQVKSMTEKSTGSFKADWNHLCEIVPENVGDALTMQTTATIIAVGKPNMYKACECNKKLNDLNNGLYRCDKCSKETDRFFWKLIMSFSIADFSKNVWVQSFPDQSLKLLGNRNIDELGELSLTDPNQLEIVLKSIMFSTYLFKLRTKMEHYNDDQKLRTQVANLSPINYQEYGNYMLKMIREH